MPTPRLPYPSTPSEYIQAPTGGWSPDVPTWELAADQAPQLENFQIKPGKLRVRPGYKVAADLTSSAPSLAGWVPVKHGTSVLTKRLYTSGFNVEPQNIHRTGVSVPAGPPAVVEQAIYIVTGGTVTRTTTSNISQVPGWRQVDYGGNKYALGYAGSAALLYNDGVTGWSNFFVDLTTPTAPVLNGSSPIGSFDIYGSLNRIWMLGGMAPTAYGGVLPASTTRLFFTNPLQALTGTITDWTDPVSGLYNQIDIDGEHNNPGVALAGVPAGLIILRQESVFILRGTDPTSYVLRPVSKQAGCLDARSVVEQDSKVYFMSDQGFMVTDGTRVQNISGALQEELYRQIAVFNSSVFNSTGAWCTADALSDGKILVSFGGYTAGSGSLNYTMIGQFSGIFDPATGVWVKVTTLITPTTSTYVGPSIAGYGEVATLGNTSVVKVEDVVAGQSVSGLSSLHDVSTVGGAFTPITATWSTRSPQANLGSRGRIHLKRSYLDYAISTGGATGTVATTLADRQLGTTLSGGATSIAVSTNASDTRQWLDRDQYPEVADMGISVVVAGGGTGAATVAKAEVHGIGVEFSATSDMRPIV